MLFGGGIISFQMKSKVVSKSLVLCLFWMILAPSSIGAASHDDLASLSRGVTYQLIERIKTYNCISLTMTTLV